MGKAFHEMSIDPSMFKIQMNVPSEMNLEMVIAMFRHNDWKVQDNGWVSRRGRQITIYIPRKDIQDATIYGYCLGEGPYEDTTDPVKHFLMCYGEDDDDE